MDAAESLRVFDVTSSFFGIMTFTENNRFLKYLNFTRAWTLPVITFFVFAYLPSAVTVLRQGRFLWDLAGSVYFLSELTYVLILLPLLRKKISRILDVCFIRMTLKQQQTVKRTSHVLVVLMVLQMLYYNVCFSWSQVNRLGYQWNTFLLLLVVFYDIPFEFHGFSLCIIMLLCCYFASQNSMRNIFKMIRKCQGISGCSADCDQILESVAKATQDFNCVAGKIISILFLVLYFYIPSKMFYAASTNGVERVWMQAELALIALHLVGVVIIIITAQKVSNELDKERNKIVNFVTKIDTCHCSSQGMVFILQLKDPALFQFTGNNMFTLDNGLILNFAGSLITFTILLCQLESSPEDPITSSVLDKHRQQITTNVTDILEKLQKLINSTIIP